MSSRPSRAAHSLPARLAASVPTSERTTAHEASCISATHDGAKVHVQKAPPMKEWKDITHYAGFDWARHDHAVVVVNKEGQIIADFQFNHSLEGWKSFQDQTAAWPNLAVAIETNQGAAVDQLLQGGYTVYPVNPIAAESYRKRKAPSGTKTDHIDGWALADALRLEGHGWKILQPMDPLTQQLRLLCHDEVKFIEQRTALVNQLQQALVEYYPAALQAFDDWTCPYTWAFVLQFPTPQALSAAGKRPATSPGEPSRRAPQGGRWQRHATMLCFITTDAAIERSALQDALEEAVAHSFNRITVDGDMSTNDTVLLLASRTGSIPLDGAGVRAFTDALTGVCVALARQIARDGEGATRLVEITVTGGRDEPEAHRVADSIARSPLVKTAIHGGDPNWGRLIAVAGRAGVRFELARAAVAIGTIVLFNDGRPHDEAAPQAAEYLKNDEITVQVNLGVGTASATVWTCDLSAEYVRINAEYRT